MNYHQDCNENPCPKCRGETLVLSGGMGARTTQGHPFQAANNTYEIRFKDGMVAKTSRYVAKSDEERQALDEAMRTTGYVTVIVDGVRVVGLVLS
jgi:hypothetical protein